MSYRFMFVLIGICLLFNLNLGITADFEGIVKMRTISMATYDLPGGEDIDPSLESVSAFAKQLFSKSLDEIVAMGRSGEEFNDQVMEIKIKAGKIRMDMNQMGQKMSSIYNPSNNKIYNVMWDSKMVMVLDPVEMKNKMKAAGQGMEDMMSQMDGMMDDGSEKYEFKMVATGQKKTINGFPVSQYVGNSEDGEYLEFWLDKNNFDIYGALTKAFEGFSQDLEENDAEMDGEEAFLLEQKAIPIIRYSLSADELEIQELVSIEKKPMSADEFTIPANFKQISMQEMMRQQFQQMQQQMQQLEDRD